MGSSDIFFCLFVFGRQLFGRSKYTLIYCLFVLAAAANNPRGASAAPNVTVDATGRPSPTQSSLVTAGSQIRVAAGTSQQLLNQVLGARVTQTPTTKLQVVHAPVPQSSAAASAQQTSQTSQQTSQQQTQQSTQQNQQSGGASGDQSQQQKN